MKETPINGIKMENNPEKPSIIQRFFDEYEKTMMGFIYEHKDEISRGGKSWEHNFSEEKNYAKEKFGKDVLEQCKNYPEYLEEVKKLLDWKSDSLPSEDEIIYLLISRDYSDKFKKAIENIQRNGITEKAA